MKRITVFAALLILACSNAYGGWYQVSNYVGSIGKYPIHLSIQKSDHSFGAGVTIEGSYYYDSHITAIPIYGKYDSAGNIELCEIHNDDGFAKIVGRGPKSPLDTNACQFHLKISEVGAQGVWTANGKTYDVTLSLSATLDDTGNGLTQGVVEIPYWGQTQNHLFVGVYEGIKTRTMFKIKVINKHTRTIVQEIDPQQNDCSAGYFMTQIYMNVESVKPSDPEQIMINCAGPKGGDYAIYQLNKDTKKFEFAFMQ